MTTEKRTCPRCEGDGCDLCEGYGSVLVDDDMDASDAGVVDTRFFDTEEA